MERECLELQENYRDQIENINVNTQIELEKLQPYMREIKQRKQDDMLMLTKVREEREAL